MAFSPIDALRRSNFKFLRAAIGVASLLTLTACGGGAAVPGAVASGGFTIGGSSVSCATASTGACSIASGSISNRTTQTTFSVNGISGTNLGYDATRNAVGSVIVKKPA